jgi:hypothetical protein
MAMRRTATITTIALVALLALTFAYRALSSSSPSAPHATKPVLHTTAKAWDGQSTRSYSTIFERDNEALELFSVSYSGLDTAATDVVATMKVTPSGGSTSWLAPSSFQVRSASDQVYVPKVSITPAGPIDEVTITAKGLPTTGLGDTCQTPQDPTQALGLFVFSPDGLFVIQLVPPAPPPGHCFDSPIKQAPACGTASGQIKDIEEADAKRHEAIAKAHGHERALLEARDKATLASERPLRAQAQATLDSGACTSVAPSPGRPLDSADRAKDSAAATAQANGGGYTATP